MTTGFVRVRNDLERMLIDHDQDHDFGECGRGMPRPYELAGWKTRPPLSGLRVQFVCDGSREAIVAKVCQAPSDGG